MRLRLELQPPPFPSLLQVETDRIHHDLREYLQNALVATAGGVSAITAETRALGYSESQLWAWLDAPANAPLRWIVSVSRLLGITAQVSSILIDAMID
jgi:hypothetical protein